MIHVYLIYIEIHFPHGNLYVHYQIPFLTSCMSVASGLKKIALVFRPAANFLDEVWINITQSFGIVLGRLWK